MKQYLYGVDLGGTTVKLGLFSIKGELKEQFSIVTNTSNQGEFILPDIANAIKTNMEKNEITKEQVSGIGIGVPGPVSNGVVNKCVNLGWGIVDVSHELSTLTGLPVSVSNDANVAGLGELWMGGGKGYKDLIFITLGTGVGGAVVVNGNVIDGFNGCGGELGHASIPNFSEGFMCNCGKTGCLETVASATGVVRVAKQKIESTDVPSVLRNRDAFEAKDVFDAAKSGDQLALDVVYYFGQSLAYVCSIIAVTTNPEVFVFGGGVSKAGEIITDVVRKHFEPIAFYGLREATQFKLATLGNDAGIYGAAYLAKSL